MPHCNSWKPTRVDHSSPLPRRGTWTQCRNSVDQTGWRCPDCWATLTAHPSADTRIAVANELSSGANDDPSILEQAWDLLSIDEDPQVRISLLGPNTPSTITALLTTDESPLVSREARRLLGLLQPA